MSHKPPDYQHVSTPEQRSKAGFKRSATLRAAVFIVRAVLGNRSRTPVLYIAESWGGLNMHKPLMEAHLFPIVAFLPGALRSNCSIQARSCRRSGMSLKT